MVLEGEGKKLHSTTRLYNSNDVKYEQKVNESENNMKKDCNNFHLEENFIRIYKLALHLSLICEKPSVELLSNQF